MRQSITIAQGHDGKWTTLHLPDVPLEAQLERVKQLAGSRVNDDYARVLVVDVKSQLKAHKFDSQLQVNHRVAQARKAEAEFAKARSKKEREVSSSEKVKAEKLNASRKADHELKSKQAAQLAADRVERLKQSRAKLDAPWPTIDKTNPQGGGGTIVGEAKAETPNPGK